MEGLQKVHGNIQYEKILHDFHMVIAHFGKNCKGVTFASQRLHRQEAGVRR